MTVFFYKIEGHSNHKWNDQADQLARMGTNQQNAFDLNYKKICKLSHYYGWNNILTNIPIKETTKKANKVKHIIELTNLVRHDCSLNDKICKQIDIELTVAMLGFTKMNHMKNTKKDQLLRKKIIKLFNDELPMKHV